jgi:uncharacterized protein with FMN-binding domain
MDHEQAPAMTIVKHAVPFLRTLAALAFWAVCPGAGNTGGPAAVSITAVSETGSSLSPAAVTSGPKLRDGIYKAESPGWTGMAVAVHVADGRLACVDVLKAKGTPRYYDRVVQRLPVLMKEKGSAEVDGITGATLSCNSLKEAVRAALKKAGPDTLPSR